MFWKKRDNIASETPTSCFIPYSHHVTNSIIATKQGDYLSIWEVKGRSHQGASLEDVFTWVNELNNMVRGISSSNISFWSHIIRTKESTYPESKFSDSFCQKLDDKYRQRFADYNLMANTLYLTVIYQPSSDKILSFLARHEKVSVEEKKMRQMTALDSLNEINDTIKSALTRYDATLLETYEKNSATFSKPLEFLSLLVNGEHKPMPVCRERFSEYLMLNRPFFSTWGSVGELRTTAGPKRFGMLEIREYDSSTEPGQLNELLKSNFEFILSQSFSILSRYAATDYLKKHKQNLIDAKDIATGQIAEIDDALNQLGSGEFVMGDHHCTLLIYGETVKDIQEHLSQASSTMHNFGIIPKPVDLALEAAFWAQLPCNWSYRPRPAPITSLNFLSLSPFHNFMSGKSAGNPWGPAVTTFKTISSTRLHFNFHASPHNEDSTEKRLLGNTMIIGQSSSGKTVLLGFLIAQSKKFDPTIVVIDKDRGMEIAVRAMNGIYLSLQVGRPSGFNPFQLAPTEKNILFLQQLVKKLISVNGGLVTHEDDLDIDHAISTLMSTSIPKKSRTLSTLRQLLPNPMTNNGSSSASDRLKKWERNERYGWLFDNDTDVLDTTSNKLYGFDITEFLDDPDLRTPIMMYLLFRTEEMIDGRRFMYVFDEFWKPLQDEYFEDLAKNKQKTIRKQNGIFVFATQEPSDALQSPIAKTLIQQCATQIFLSNPKADYEDYTKGFKLTDAEFELIQGLGEFSRQFLIKQGNSCALAELDLDGFNEELLILSGTPDNADLVNDIIKVRGNNPDNWIAEFTKQTIGRHKKDSHDEI